MLSEAIYSKLVSQVLTKQGEIVRSDMMVGAMSLRLYMCYKTNKHLNKDEHALVIISTPIKVMTSQTKPMEFNHYTKEHLTSLVDAIDRHVDCIDVETKTSNGVLHIYVGLRAIMSANMGIPYQPIKTCLDYLITEWYMIYNIIETLSKDVQALLQAEDIEGYFQHKRTIH